MNLRSRCTGIATGDQAIFVRRDAFERIGGFPDQPLMEDIELSSACASVGRPACLRQRVVTSGRRWERARRVAHHRADVAAARRLLARRCRRPTRARPPGMYRSRTPAPIIVFAKAPVPGYAKTRLIAGARRRRARRAWPSA